MPAPGRRLALQGVRQEGVTVERSRRAVRSAESIRHRARTRLPRRGVDVTSRLMPPQPRRFVSSPLPRGAPRSALPRRGSDPICLSQGSRPGFLKCLLDINEEDRSHSFEQTSETERSLRGCWFNDQTEQRHDDHSRLPGEGPKTAPSFAKGRGVGWRQSPEGWKPGAQLG